jgi:CRISPR-associated protein Cas2
MNYLVAYDITENKVRNRLSKYLSKYGVRLQKSVFIVSIQGHQRKGFVTGIEKITGKKGDVALFRLCKGCQTTAIRLAEIRDEFFVF